MRKLYIDLTHLGRHVTGLERISIDLFEKSEFGDFRLVPVRTPALPGPLAPIGMIVMQQLWLPLLAIFNRRSLFVFPGFPPSPIFALMPDRTVLYVHDLFLMTRPADLNLKARYYMRPAFALAVRRLRHFLVNSEKTAAELRAHCRSDATIDLYRPGVSNVFGLALRSSASIGNASKPLRLVSLGTVEPRKNYAAALSIKNALAEIRGTTVELHIIGRPGWGEDAERLAAADSVVMHGFLSSAQAKAVIEAADMYLCTSHDEGLGLPLLEVQYAGIPVAAPDAPVFHEVLGQSAIFIDPAAPMSAARMISAALGDASRALTPVLPAENLARWSALADRDRAVVSALFKKLSVALGQ